MNHIVLFMLLSLQSDSKLFTVKRYICKSVCTEKIWSFTYIFCQININPSMCDYVTSSFQKSFSNALININLLKSFQKVKVTFQ